MKRPQLQTFIEFVRKYDKTSRPTGLRLLYKDFEVRPKDRKRFFECWKMIAKELDNATNSEGREGKSGDGENLRQAEGGEGVLCVPERRDDYGDAPIPQEEETTTPEGQVNGRCNSIDATGRQVQAAETA